MFQLLHRLALLSNQIIRLNKQRSHFQPISQHASYIKNQFLHDGSRLYGKSGASRVAVVWIKR